MWAFLVRAIFSNSVRMNSAQCLSETKWKSELCNNDPAHKGIPISQFALIAQLHTQHSFTVSLRSSSTVTQVTQLGI